MGRRERKQRSLPSLSSGQLWISTPVPTSSQPTTSPQLTNESNSRSMVSTLLHPPLPSCSSLHHLLTSTRRYSSRATLSGSETATAAAALTENDSSAFKFLDLTKTQRMYGFGIWFVVSSFTGSWLRVLMRIHCTVCWEDFQ